MWFCVFKIFAHNHLFFIRHRETHAKFNVADWPLLYQALRVNWSLNFWEEILYLKIVFYFRTWEKRTKTFSGMFPKPMRNLNASNFIKQLNDHHTRNHRTLQSPHYKSPHSKSLNSELSQSEKCSTFIFYSIFINVFCIYMFFIIFSRLS